MNTLLEIQKEREFNNELTQLMDVLKGIASARFRELERKKDRFQDFKSAFDGFFSMINFDLLNHPLAKDDLKKTALMLVTSDEGFMGGLNSRVVNAALSFAAGKDVLFIVLGSKGAFLLNSLGYDFAKFPAINTQQVYEQALEIKDYIIKENKKRSFGRLVVFYPQPVSFSCHKISSLVLLPCSDLAGREKDVCRKNHKDLIVESPIEGILEYLMEAWILQELLEIFEDSKLSEFSSRTVHLEESYQVLLGREANLQLEYLKSYHDFLDQGIRESFSVRMVNKR